MSENVYQISQLCSIEDEVTAAQAAPLYLDVRPHVLVLVPSCCSIDFELLAPAYVNRLLDLSLFIEGQANFVLERQRSRASAESKGASERWTVMATDSPRCLQRFSAFIFIFTRPADHKQPVSKQQEGVFPPLLFPASPAVAHYPNFPSNMVAIVPLPILKGPMASGLRTR